MAYRLIIDGAAMEEQLRGPGGDVIRNGNRVGDEIIALARTKITQRKRGPAGPGGAGFTLAGTLVKRWGVGGSGPELTIAAMAPYAYWVHEGNKSNRGDGRIWPVRAKALRFVIPGGGFVFRRNVRESTPNPFLRDAMNEIVPQG